MKEYQTQQRRRLLDFFADHSDQQFSVEDIAQSLEGISMSAIYRNIHWLTEAGAVKRFQRDGSRCFLYQYFGEDCTKHLHLKCDKCGHILHMDSSISESLEKMLAESSHFNLDKCKTVLLGSCASCQSKRKRGGP